MKPHKRLTDVRITALVTVYRVPAEVRLEAEVLRIGDYERNPWYYLKANAEELILRQVYYENS